MALIQKQKKIKQLINLAPTPEIFSSSARFQYVRRDEHTRRSREMESTKNTPVEREILVEYFPSSSPLQNNVPRGNFGDHVHLECVAEAKKKLL